MPIADFLTDQEMSRLDDPDVQAAAAAIAHRLWRGPWPADPGDCELADDAAGVWQAAIAVVDLFREG